MKKLTIYFATMLMFLSLPLILLSCGNDEPENDVPNNTTDVAVTGSATDVGALYAQISGVVNLDLITAAYTSVNVGVEYSTQTTFQEKTRVNSNELTGRKLNVRLPVLHPETKYYYRTFVSVSTLSYDYYGETKSFTTKKIADKDKYVDLGLPSGTLWATLNVGASSPDDYGIYFAWGETSPKEIYNQETYKWVYFVSDGYGGTHFAFSKYSTENYWGEPDNKTELDLEDDAAYVNWGSSWRMPSSAQQEELSDKCTWKWMMYNGVNGLQATGPNGNTLFLPAGGKYKNDYKSEVGSFGCYWSRTLEDLGDEYASLIFVRQKGINRGEIEYYRYYGRNVRAVRISK